MSDHLLAEMRGHPHWKEQLNLIRDNFPSVGAFDPNGEDQEDRWKFDSGVRTGFLLALSLFKIKPIEVEHGRRNDG